MCDSFWLNPLMFAQILTILYSFYQRAVNIFLRRRGRRMAQINSFAPKNAVYFERRKMPSAKKK